MAHSELLCPHCGSDRVYIYDHQPLATNDMELPVDNEIYVHLKCDICKDTFETVGNITYKQPEPISKTVKVLIELSVPVKTDTQVLLENIHNILLCSDNVTSKKVIRIENFVD